MIYPKEQFPNFFQVDIIELSLEETEFNSKIRRRGKWREKSVEKFKLVGI